MAFIPVIAQNTNLAFVQGSGFQGKAIPRNPDGTVYDCTGLTQVNLSLKTDSVTGNELTTVALGAGTADATGFIWTISPADVSNLSALLGTNRGAYDITLTDGTDDVNGSYGNIAVQLTGLPSA